MNQMKEYYLDTVAIRKLTKELTKFKDICFTSALAITELIAGISESDFIQRKAAIRSLLNSKIEVDWRTVIEIVISSFPRPGYREIAMDDLKVLCVILDQSENKDEFITKSMHLKHGVEYFIKFDEELRSGFAKAMGNKINGLRKERADENSKITYTLRTKTLVKAFVN